MRDSFVSGTNEDPTEANGCCTSEGSVIVGSRVLEKSDLLKLIPPIDIIIVDVLHLE